MKKNESMNAVKVLLIAKMINKFLMKVGSECEEVEKETLLKLPELKRLQSMLIVIFI